MPWVRMGNITPIEMVRNPDDEDGPRVPQVVGDGSPTVTVSSLPDDISLLEMVGTLVAPVMGAWCHASPVPPAWVESNNTSLATVLADTWKCPIGEFDGWDAQ